MNRCNIGKIGIGLVLCVLSSIACADLPKPTATIEARATIVRGCQLSNIEQMLSFNKQAAVKLKHILRIQAKVGVFAVRQTHRYRLN